MRRLPRPLRGDPRSAKRVDSSAVQPFHIAAKVLQAVSVLPHESVASSVSVAVAASAWLNPACRNTLRPKADNWASDMFIVFLRLVRVGFGGTVCRESIRSRRGLFDSAT